MFELRKMEGFIRWYERELIENPEKAKQEWKEGLEAIEEAENILDEYLNEIIELFINAEENYLNIFFEAKFDFFFNISKKIELLKTKVEIERFIRKMKKIKEKQKRVEKLKQRYLQFKYFCSS